MATADTNMDTIIRTRTHPSDDTVTLMAASAATQIQPRRVRFASSELIPVVDQQQQPSAIHFTEKRSEMQAAVQDGSTVNASSGCCWFSPPLTNNSKSASTMIPFGRRRRSSRQHQPRQQRSTSFSSLSSTLFPSLSSSTTSSHISSDTQISSGTHEKEQHSHLSKLNKFIVSSITTSLSSLLSSNNKTAGTKPREICLDHLLEQYSIELKHLYLNAKAELDCAIETQGSVYYKDDRVTAGNALKSCNDKYFHVMDFLGDTTHAIKFKCRWERELEDLQSVFQDLPLSTPPVILEEEHEPSTAYQYFHKYN